MPGTARKAPSEPYIFFHMPSLFWHEGTDPALLKCQSINDEAVQHLLSSLSINVSDPELLMKWLDNNSASYITTLHVVLHAYYDAPSAHLTVYWDHEDWFHRGMGKDVVFVRALVQLKVAKTIKIDGMYAMHWPAYIEEKMGIKPFNKELHPGSNWPSMLRSYQRGTEKLFP